MFRVAKINIGSNSEDTFNHDFESILKNLSKFSKSKQSNNIRIQKETIDFRYELFKNLANNKFEFSSNLTSSQLECLKIFKREKPFTILQCDKNVGSLIISNDNFIKLVNEHLFTDN